MKVSNAGLLLLIVGALGLTGFLTGNLDRWLGYLFNPSRPPLSAGSTSTSATGTSDAHSGSGSTTPTIAVASTNPLLSVGGTTQRSVA